jgi:low temperature requirement protein LtrA
METFFAVFAYDNCREIPGDNNHITERFGLLAIIALESDFFIFRTGNFLLFGRHVRPPALISV